jgi:3-oxo-5alpha-steroid 4-dehydrogenase
MSMVSAWRFLTPPSALLRGILVDQSGDRFIDESTYGAAIGERLVLDRGGRAWLLVDDAILRDARRQLRTETLWFQRLSSHYLLRVSRVRGATVEEVARKAGIDPAGLAATVEKYGRGEDAFGKHPDLVAPLTGPYALIDCSFGPRLGYPCPTLTLGGLKVDEGTGQVVDADGAGVPGLYAAGRNAVGICSNSYVSGLSLADCVFSGRRAGRHASGEVSSEMT